MVGPGEERRKGECIDTRDALASVAVIFFFFFSFSLFFCNKGLTIGLKDAFSSSHKRSGGGGRIDRVQRATT